MVGGVKQSSDSRTSATPLDSAFGGAPFPNLDDRADDTWITDPPPPAGFELVTTRTRAEG